MDFILQILDEFFTSLKHVYKIIIFYVLVPLYTGLGLTGVERDRGAQRVVLKLVNPGKQ